MPDREYFLALVASLSSERKSLKPSRIPPLIPLRDLDQIRENPLLPCERLFFIVPPQFHVFDVITHLRHWQTLPHDVHNL